MICAFLKKGRAEHMAASSLVPTKAQLATGGRSRSKIPQVQGQMALKGLEGAVR